MTTPESRFETVGPALDIGDGIDRAGLVDFFARVNVDPFRAGVYQYIARGGDVEAADRFSTVITDLDSFTLFSEGVRASYNAYREFGVELVSTYEDRLHEWSDEVAELDGDVLANPAEAAHNIMRCDQSMRRRGTLEGIMGFAASGDEFVFSGLGSDRIAEAPKGLVRLMGQWLRDIKPDQTPQPNGRIDSAAEYIGRRMIMNREMARADTFDKLADLYDEVTQTAEK